MNRVGAVACCCNKTNVVITQVVPLLLMRGSVAGSRKGRGGFADGSLFLVCYWLWQEARWALMKLSARGKRFSIFISLAMARAVRVWAGRHNIHISRRRSTVRVLPMLFGGRRDKA